MGHHGMGHRRMGRTEQVATWVGAEWAVRRGSTLVGTEWLVRRGSSQRRRGSMRNGSSDVARRGIDVGLRSVSTWLFAAWVIDVSCAEGWVTVGKVRMEIEMEIERLKGFGREMGKMKGFLEGIF